MQKPTAPAPKASAAEDLPQPPKTGRDPLIIYVSELSRMTDHQKQAFREAGGTVTNDPVSPQS